MSVAADSIPPAGERGPAARERWWRPPGVAACVAFATLLTLLMAAPLLRAPGERMFGHEIVGRYHDPYTVALWFEQPTAPNLYTQPATDYLGALVARAVGGVAAYNFVVLWSFPLAAWFAYLLAFQVTRSRGGSWLTALAYAFAPFHIVHAAYHPQVAQTQWLPLYLLTLWLALEHASWRRLALMLTALGLVGLSNFYGGLIALVTTPFAIAGGWLAARRVGAIETGRNLARIAVAFGAVGLAGWSYLRLVAPTLLRRPSSLAFPASDLARYTARWYSYLVPPVEHPLLGARARAFWERVTLPGDLLEHQLTIGIGLLLLAGVAVNAWLRDQRRPGVRAVPALLLVGGAAFLFSLAPVWTVAGISLRAPSAWLYRIAPMFRADARFGIVVLLASALLAAIGFLELVGRRRPSSTLAACALLSLAVFELTPLPPFRWRDILPTPAHRWLRQQPGPVKVLDCVSAAEPVERAVPKLFGPGLAQLSPLGDCSEPGLPGKVAAQGFTHLIVRRASPDGELFANRALPAGLRVVQEFDSARLFAVDTPPSALYLGLSNGFYLRQRHDDRSYRWMGQRGTIQVVNRTGSPRRVVVRLTLHAMPHARRVLYALGTGPTSELGTATNDPASFQTRPLDLAPGTTPLRLWTEEPATVADSVLHNGDQRALAVALWEWEIVTTAP